jgi:hypothetical protein
VSTAFASATRVSPEVHEVGLVRLPTFASQALGTEPGESDSWVVLAARVLGVERTAVQVLQIEDLGEGFVAVRVERDDGSSQGTFGSFGAQAIGVVVVSGADRGQTLAMPPPRG